VAKWTRDVVKPSTGNSAGDAHLMGNFTIEADGLEPGGVHGVSGLDSESEAVESQNCDDQFTRLRPGRHKTSTVTLTRDWACCDDWLKWFQTVLDGKVERKSLAIRYLTDDVSKTGSRHELFQVWPKKWSLSGLNSKNSGHAQESIELVYETINFTAG